MRSERLWKWMLLKEGDGSNWFLEEGKSNLAVPDLVSGLDDALGEGQIGCIDHVALGVVSEH